MSLAATQAYRRTPKGVLTNVYHHQVFRRKEKGLPAPEYTLSEFHEKFLNDPIFLKIHEEWLNNGMRKNDKPSFDRIDPNKGYSFDNIQVMTWAQNREKGDRENAERFTTAISMFDQSGNLIREFGSVKEAVKETGLNLGLIVACCQGKRNHTGGYVFKYRGDRFRRRLS